MSNPMLREKTVSAVTQDPQRRLDAGDVPVTATSVLSATATLLILLLMGAWVGWFTTEPQTLLELEVDGPTPPGSAVLVAVVALVLAIVAAIRPAWAGPLGACYAPLEGFVIGAVSRRFDAYASGAVLAAAGATVAVLVAIVVLYAMGVVRPAHRITGTLAAATGGLIVFWLSVALLDAGGVIDTTATGGGVGLVVSLISVAVAAAWLVDDLATIEEGIAAGAPQHLRWAMALALIVTLVWIYLEMLKIIVQLMAEDDD